MRRLRALAAALTIAAGLLAAPGTSPTPAVALGPLPDCRLDDVLTVPRGYDDWSITLADWTLSLGSDYKPPDLVSINRAGVTGGGQVRRVALDDLKAMAAAARAHGTPLGSISAYRSYSQQVALFKMYADGYGFDDAVTFSARPGHSEHQLGLVIDFSPSGVSKFVSSTDPTGRWLAANAWKYGWLLSYPKDKQDVVCYSFEPWHYRYFGRELAKKIHDSGLTTREYLWANFTMVDAVTGSPLPTVTPTPAATPSPSPAVEPSPTPSAPGAASAPAATTLPGPTSPPASAAGTWFGLAPPVVVGLLGLVAVVMVFTVALGLRRRRAA